MAERNMKVKAPTVYLIVLLFIIINPANAIENSAWGINTHVPTTEQLDICNELGVGWIRVSFNWADIEAGGKNQLNWGTLDNVVAQASARNIHIFGSIGDTPSWAGRVAAHASARNIHICGRSDPPLNSNDWYDFVYACVNRYSYWVRHWGMWNEPNLQEFWTGSWIDYITLILIPGHRAAKAANPECFVLAPELSDKNRIDALEFLNLVMENAGSYIDIVTQHSYGSMASDVTHFIDRFVYPALQIRAPGKELWLTETGWRTDTQGEDLQAIMYQEMCKAVESREHLKKVFFYQLSDGPETEKWGIVSYPDGSRKPAFFSYQSHISGSTPPPIASGCFIATAAFGTPLANEVIILSEFRDRYLMTNTAGRKFVRCYYKISPTIAKIISRNKLLRFAVRIGLQPLAFLCIYTRTSFPSLEDL